VVVAVIAVTVVQSAVDEVVDVVTVRHRLMPTACPVGVVVRMAYRRAGVAVGMLVVDFEGVLVDVVAVRMMQVTVVQVVDMVGVVDGGVAAGRAVHMVMSGVGCVMVAHRVRPYGAAAPAAKHMRTGSAPTLGLISEPRRGLGCRAPS